MSDYQNDQKLNEQHMNTCLLNTKNEKRNKQQLKTWKIYCKWRGKKCIKQQYTQDLQQVGTFNTIHTFFQYYSSIKQPSTLQQDTKIIYFLNNCQPFWEQWLHTGCLLITLKFKGQQKDKIGSKILNSIWQFLLFSIIGNNLPQSKFNKQCQKSGQQSIIGLILSRRDKISVIQIWYRVQTNALQLSRLIQQDIQNYLKYSTKQQKNVISGIRYKRHKDSIQSNSTIKGAHSIKTVGNKTF